MQRYESNDTNTCIDFYSKEDNKEYDEFIKNERRSTIYHTLEWKDILEKNFGYDSYYLIARDKDDTIRAVLPLFLVENLLGKRLHSIYQSCYGGGIGEKKYVFLLIKKAIELKEKLNCKFFVMRGDPLFYDDIVSNIGMKKFELWYKQSVTIINPLLMWNNINKNNRTNIRKAIKNNVIIQKAKKRSDIKEFYYLYLLTKKRLGFGPCSFKFFVDIWDKMKSKGLLEIFIAKHDGRSVSSTLNFTFKDKFFSSFIGWDIKKSNLKANNLLDWSCLVWCNEHNYKLFDFGITDRDNEGLFIYKSSFNASINSYARYVYPSSINYSNNQVFLKNIGRKILNKTPLVINRKIGMTFNKIFA